MSNKSQKVLLSICIFLVGFILWYFGVNLEHDEKNSMHEWSPHLKEIGHFAMLIISLHFLYEVSVKKTDQEVILKQIHQYFSPTSESVKELVQQTKTISDLVKYSDDEFFFAKWKQISKNYKFLYIISGYQDNQLIPIAIENLKTSTQELYLFGSIGYKNRTIVENIVSEIPKLNNRLKVHHTGRFDWGFIAIGYDGNENVRLLFNYEKDEEKNKMGYYLSGKSAKMMFDSLRTNLPDYQNKNEPKEIENIIPIYDKETIEYILLKKADYSRSLKDIRKGVPIKNIEGICEKMIRVLNDTKVKMVVTHVANEVTIPLMKDEYFEKWLRCNYEAIDRNVSIERIFLINKKDQKNKEFLEVAEEMYNKKIKVKYLIIDEGMDIEDFSIYDDKTVIYIDLSGLDGGWKVVAASSNPLARIATQDKLVNRYKRIYNEYSKKSIEFKF